MSNITIDMEEENRTKIKDAIFRLLDLPRELRDLVYEHAVTTDSFTIQGVDLFDLLGHDKRVTEKMAMQRKQALESYRVLARVSRQLHGEVEAVLFIHNRFAFWTIEHDIAAELGPWLHRVNDNFVARLQKIRIVQAPEAGEGFGRHHTTQDERLISHQVQWRLVAK